MAVLGAGSWGTALAILAAAEGPVRLWCRRPEFARQLGRERHNATYLPGAVLPPSLSVTARLEEALAEAELVVIAVPVQGMRSVLEQVRAAEAPRAFVLASKGIEQQSLALPVEIVREAVGAGAAARSAVLSGPSFAREVARGQPAAVVAAAGDEGIATTVQQALSRPRFRIYTSDDPIGVQLAGALKNVYAIASGVADGLGAGTSARAALITRALAEMARLGRAFGARPETFAGLAGMGDLVLTATGDLSRNRRVGIELGKGRPLADILGETRMVAEGVATAPGAVALARREGVEMPIAVAVDALLRGAETPREALDALMTRPLKAERDPRA